MPDQKGVFKHDAPTEQNVQVDYISGKRYKAQKNINRFKGNQYTKESGGTDNLYNQNTTERPHQDKTILQRAKAEGVSHNTIDQNQKFAQGIDAVKEVAPEHRALHPRDNQGVDGLVTQIIWATKADMRYRPQGPERHI